jgi:Bacterial SH3 domain
MAAINHNPNSRQPQPRQPEGMQIPFPKGGIYFFPVEQPTPAAAPESEPKATRREKESSGLIPLLTVMLILLLCAGIYWNGGTPAPAPVAPMNFTQPDAAAAARRVGTVELNLREQPNPFAPVTRVLPQGTPVELLHEQQEQLDGTIWERVRVQVNGGSQEGWVNAEFLR